MGDFLRDSTPTFLTIEEKQLSAINEELCRIRDQANTNGIAEDAKTSLNYVLRYDGMGMIRTDFQEIKRCFDNALKVERVVLQLTCPKNATNKGKNIEVRLDSATANNCLLRVIDDDKTWVDSNFGTLKALLGTYKNKSGLAYSGAMELLIQLMGVLFGLSLCLLGANLLAPAVSIRYSFFVLLFGLFLVFSNLWAYVRTLIGRARARLWPVISFKRRPLGLVGQTLVAAIVAALLAQAARMSWAILKSLGSMTAR